MILEAFRKQSSQVGWHPTLSLGHMPALPINTNASRPSLLSFHAQNGATHWPPPPSGRSFRGGSHAHAVRCWFGPKRAQRGRRPGRGPQRQRQVRLIYTVYLFSYFWIALHQGLRSCHALVHAWLLPYLEGLSLPSHTTAAVCFTTTPTLNPCTGISHWTILGWRIR